VLLSTHILPEVSLLCQRVLIIHHGRLIADARPQELQSHAGDRMRVDIEARGEQQTIETVLASVAGVESLESTASGIPGVVRCRVTAIGANDPREAIASALAAGGIGLRTMAAASVTLEDVFVQLVTRED
jgi:ABC-2 type transport system ATP-binding protein